MKKFMTYFIILLVVMLPVLGVDAAKKKKTTTTTTTTQAGEKVNFYIFYGSTCGYCQRLHEYVAELEKDPTINYMFNVVDYEVWGDAENNRLMTEVAKDMDYDVTGVPVYVIGEQIFGGYSEERNDSIRKAIEDAYSNKDTKDMVSDIAAEILSGDRTSSESKKNKTVGFIILGVTAIVVVAILFSKNNTSYYDDEDDDDEDDEVDEEESKQEKPKKEVKKTTTKSTTTKKTNAKSKK